MAKFLKIKFLKTHGLIQKKTEFNDKNIAEVLDI